MPDDLPPPVLRIEDLSVSFPQDNGPRTHAVRGVSLALRPGRTTAVVGESGSGKSVTALSVLRLLASPPARYESGRILYTPGESKPVDILRLDDRALRDLRGNQIAMIFQEPMTSLNPVLSIGAQITEAIRLHRKVSARDAQRLALKAMHDVGIDRGPDGLKAYPHEFSGGMRQRVMIAIALACEPAILIADEPTTALDVTIQAQILDLIRALKRDRRLAVMFITHDLGLVAEHADEVTVMYAGRVVESGPIDAVLHSPRHPYTRGLLAAAPAIDDRRERLETLDVFLARDADRTIRAGAEGHEAWWPRGGETSAGSSPRESRLIEVEPGHHVRVWNETVEVVHKSPTAGNTSSTG